MTDKHDTHLKTTHSTPLALSLALLLATGNAAAQRVGENATASAEDAFGTSIGNEKVGLYSASEVRGFSPITAGNIRVEGLYYDRPGGFTDRMVENSVIRVGPTAQNYLFPAPTGIVDYRLRPSGNTHVVSTLFGYGTLGGGRIEVDSQLPVIEDRLSVAAGAAAYLDELPSGADAFVTSYGLVPRWKPAEHVEIIPFWGRIDTRDKEATPLYVNDGSALPAPARPRRYAGPDWADTRASTSNYGAVAKVGMDDGWRWTGGLFRSVNDARTGHAFVLRDLAADGTANLRITADPAQRTQSDSGELRLSRKWRHGDARSQALHLSLRGRDRQALYGGGDTVDFGRGAVEAPFAFERPAFEFGERTRDRVRQSAAGLAYEGHWAGSGSVNFGVQQVDYRKRVERPGVAPAESIDRPLLYNAALSWNAAPRLAFYGSHTHGLEESGVAPDSAANRTQALPAIHTRQSDLGLRWILPRELRLVASLFDVRKPYFSTNDANVYTIMGDVRHPGVELSLAGPLGEALTVVAGAVLMAPEVTGALVDEGVIGSRPVGQTRHLLTLSGNYALSAVPGLVLTMNANHHGGRVADRANRVSTPATTLLDLGARYRFRLGTKPALLRLQMTNVTDEFDWKVVGNAAYEVNAPRSFTLFLTVDH